jgi:hypothetical protein
MQGANEERWKVLCEQAAVEQDPKKLHELIKEINDLLKRKKPVSKAICLRRNDANYALPSPPPRTQ